MLHAKEWKCTLSLLFLGSTVVITDVWSAHLLHVDTTLTGQHHPASYFISLSTMAAMSTPTSTTLRLKWWRWWPTSPLLRVECRSCPFLPLPSFLSPSLPFSPSFCSSWTLSMPLSLLPSQSSSSICLSSSFLPPSYLIPSPPSFISSFILPIVYSHCQYTLSLLPPSCSIHFVKRPGAILHPGTLVATLEIDDPNRIKQAKKCTTKLPQKTGHGARGDKINQVHEGFN